MSSILSLFVNHKVESTGSIEQDHEEVTAHVSDAVEVPRGIIPMLMTNLEDCNKVDPALQAQNRTNCKI